MTYPFKRFRSIAVGALLSTMLPLSLSAQDATDGAGTAAEDPRAALDELKTEFVAIKSALESAREAAMQQSAVKESLAAADEALKAAMLSESPKKSDAIEQYFSTLAALSSLEDEAEAQKLSKDLAKLRRKLDSELAKASESEAVKAAQSESRERILAAMTDIDPATPELMKKQRELMARYQALREQLDESKSS